MNITPEHLREILSPTKPTKPTAPRTFPLWFPLAAGIIGGTALHYIMIALYKI
jgi:hypothetical protein